MDDAISPYATDASAGASRTRCRRGSFLATSPQKIEPAGAERDEQRTDHEPGGAAAVARGLDQEREAEHDDDRRQQRGYPPVRLAVHAITGSEVPAATITRHGA